MVRKDRDVQSLKEGQELEVVLKETGNQVAVGTSGLFPPLSNDGMPSLNVGPSGTLSSLHGPSHQQINGLH